MMKSLFEMNEDELREFMEWFCVEPTRICNNCTHSKYEFTNDKTRYVSCELDDEHTSTCWNGLQEADILRYCKFEENENNSINR